MRPRIHVPLSPVERDMVSAWRRRVLIVCALLAAAIMGHSMLTPSTSTVAQGVSKDEQARTETCVQQTGALSDAAERKVPAQVAAQGTAGLGDCR
jgi:hypothetical protein